MKCLQYALYRKLPWKFISRLYGSLTAREVPCWLRIPFYWLYIWLFRCRVEEAAVTDLSQYRSLSEFFRRSLRPGIRPVDTASELVCNVTFSLVTTCVMVVMMVVPVL